MHACSKCRRRQVCAILFAVCMSPACILHSWCICTVLHGTDSDRYRAGLCNSRGQQQGPACSTCRLYPLVDLEIGYFLRKCFVYMSGRSRAVNILHAQCTADLGPKGAYMRWGKIFQVNMCELSFFCMHGLDSRIWSW